MGLGIKQDHKGCDHQQDGGVSRKEWNRNGKCVDLQCAFSCISGKGLVLRWVYCFFAYP